MKKILIVLAVIIILIITYFVIFPINIYKMSGVSMEPTYKDGDILSVTKDINNLRRGDVVIVNVPNRKESLIVKRIIGLPGEKLSIKNNQLYINDNFYNLSQFSIHDFVYPGNLDLSLSGNQYFVLGDNVPKSADSRVFGPVETNNIIVKVLGKK
jgi:signal peptidase I